MKSIVPVTLALFAASSLFAATEPPREWIDPDTGHRVIRLSDQPGSASLYFHQNAYSPDGKKIIITTHDGISTIELATRKIEPVVTGEVRAIVVGRKSGDVYYAKREDGKVWIYATNLDTKATRKLVEMPRGGVGTLNADETLMAGTYAEDADRSWQRGETKSGETPKMANTSSGQPAAGGAKPTFQAEYEAKWPDGTPMTFAEAKDFRLHEQLMRVRAGKPRSLFTLNLKTGEVKVIL